MVARVKRVAFQGIDCLEVDVEVQAAPGLPAFTVVGLPDKVVGESRERVRAALRECKSWRCLVPLRYGYHSAALALRQRPMGLLGELQTNLCHFGLGHWNSSRRD